jgi:hypothetical protein
MKKQDFIQEFMERQRNLTPDECADLSAFVAQELFGHSGPNPISDQMQELEEMRAAYAAIREALQALQVFKDADIDWDTFPTKTLCMAHVEILKLRKSLNTCRKALAPFTAVFNQQHVADAKKAMEETK